MLEVLHSEKFQNSDMELPIAFGKTISNETYVVDLVKMPHLLMAGATGQGKSVGLNVILASLLYKKHPSQVKFVLVDPKKVELTLFNKIERHYLAKLPDAEEAIITDTKKVINTMPPHFFPALGACRVYRASPCGQRSTLRSGRPSCTRRR